MVEGSREALNFDSALYILVYTEEGYFRIVDLDPGWARFSRRQVHTPDIFNVQVHGKEKNMFSCKYQLFRDLNITLRGGDEKARPRDCII